MKDKKYFPLNFIIVYLVFTMVLYVFSPWDFKTMNPVLTFSLLITYIISFVFGYRFCMNHQLARRQIMINNSDLMMIIYILLFLNIFVLFIQLMRINGFTSIDIQIIWDKIMNGLQNPSENYYFLQEIYTNKLSSNFAGSIGSLLIIFFKPLSFSIVIASIVLFMKFNKTGKVLAIFNIMIYLARYLIMGTNKGIIDVIIIVISTLLLLYFKGDIKIKKRTMLISLGIVLFMGVSYFNINLGDRYFGKNWMNNYYLSNTVKIKEDPIIFKIIPKSMQTLAVSLSSYLCQGYYGFSLTTDVQWTPMYGLGSSQTTLYEQSAENPDFPKKTLQYKIEEKHGWIAGLSWSSLYSWFANDVSIYGVPIVMAIFGFLFALAYKDAIYMNNEFALIMFVYFMIELFYVPANNQLSVSGDSESSFLFLLVLWLISRRIRVKL